MRVIDLLRQQARVTRRLPGNAGIAREPESVKALADSARTYFDETGDEIFIADEAGRVVYVSPAAQSLSEKVVAAVSALMVRQPLPVGRGELPASNDTLMQ